MIERVARAIVETRTPGLNLTKAYLVRYGYIDEARAAIAAMREPTEEMIGYGAEGSGEDSAHVAIGAWQAMIDCALAEK